MRLTFSELAIADQDHIAEYTLDRWGDAQVVKYVGGMVDLFDLIAENPLVGRTIPKLPLRFRRVSYEAHIIFYTLRSDAVRIERILHQRMDYRRHLP